MNMIQAMQNKYGKVFKENVETLEFINKEEPKYNNNGSKNLVEIRPDLSNELQTLRSLCVDVFDDNKKLYKKNKMV